MPGNFPGSAVSSKLNLLALDTSTEACSAALLCADGQVFAEFEIAPRQHTKLLPKMMDAVLGSARCAKSAISHCAFANGPGAFTGVRIAASMAQGIGIALQIPLIPVSTLAILAQASFDRYHGESTLVALDARMNEVYWAVYRRDENSLASLVGFESLNKIEDVSFDVPISHGAGHGWLVGQHIWQARQSVAIDSGLLPNSEALLKLAVPTLNRGQVYAADKISINYLRNQVAKKPRE